PHRLPKRSPLSPTNPHDLHFRKSSGMYLALDPRDRSTLQRMFTVISPSRGPLCTIPMRS
ncbi:MAG: hypothetical protein ACK53L_29975, partial [Pirellulaceae bacterium]